MLFGGSGCPELGLCALLCMKYVGGIASKCVFSERLNVMFDICSACFDKVVVFAVGSLTKETVKISTHPHLNSSNGLSELFCLKVILNDIAFEEYTSLLIY